MKTINKNAQTHRLSKSTQHRWAWMAGATAAAAAATPHAHASTVTDQISLVGNTLDSLTGNHISLDITSGHNFAAFGTPTATVKKTQQVDLFANLGGHRYLKASAGFTIGRPLFNARISNNQNGVPVTAQKSSKSLPVSVFGLIPITLTDPNVNNGAVTDALLDVEAFNVSTTDQTVALLAVLFTAAGTSDPGVMINSSTGAISGIIDIVGYSDAGVFTTQPVPEPGNALFGLALLALGASGIVARRRQSRQQPPQAA